MSLMRLLAAGSSLVGIKDRPSPYRMTQQHLLPKFGAGKPADGRGADRPSLDVPAAEVSAASSAVPKAGPGVLEGKTQVMATEEDAVEKLPSVGEGWPSPDAALAQTPALEPATIVKRPSAIGRFGRLLQIRNPFRRRAAARKRTAAVQGELRLDEVRVVRNDLSEADLEIVPAKWPVEPAVPPVPPGPNPEAERVVWRRLASRLFGADRT